MPGIADGDLGQAFRQRGNCRIHMGLWHHDPANGGTFLARLGGHLALDFFHEQIKFRCTRGGIRS